MPDRGKGALFNSPSEPRRSSAVEDTHPTPRTVPPSAIPRQHKRARWPRRRFRGRAAREEEETRLARLIATGPLRRCPEAGLRARGLEIPARGRTNGGAVT